MDNPHQPNNDLLNNMRAADEILRGGDEADGLRIEAHHNPAGGNAAHPNAAPLAAQNDNQHEV